MASSEVQFALVISRMLDTVADDPEFRRQIVYELARYKLSEQFTHADAKNIGEMKAALEVAIREVERFSQEQPRIERPVPQQVELSMLADMSSRISPPVPVARPTNIIASGANVRPIGPVLKRAAMVLAVAGVLLLIIAQREHLKAVRSLFVSQPKEVAQVSLGTEQANLPPTPAPTPTPVPTLPRALPDAYGVYADMGDRTFVDLNLLAMRSPDIRVSISAPFKKPDQRPLRDGRVKFVVYRKDVASIPDRAEVRVVAKIARDFSGAAVGKVLNDAEEAWVVRNISYPLRSFPVPGASEMFELRSENPDQVFASGHYVLILKTQAYYFQISGDITDPSQCLERVVSTNGTFYSPCKLEKPR